MVDLSVIIITYNSKKYIKDCILSIVQNTKNINYEILVVDNNSKDKSAEIVKKLSKKYEIKLIQSKKNLGFAGANNLALKKAKGKYFLLLNPDTKIHDNVFGEIVAWMRNHPKVGIASCMLKNPDGTIQGTGGYFPTLIRVFSWMLIQDIPFVDKIIEPFHPLQEFSYQKDEGFYKTQKELDWVTGAFFLMRKEVYDQVGNIDDNYFMYTEETDYCYRAKQKGWRVQYLPKWSITHIGGASSKEWSHVLPEFKGVKLFYKKHYPKWQFPILRLLLKIGALGRMFLFGVLKGRRAAKTYAKAFKVA